MQTITAVTDQTFEREVRETPAAVVGFCGDG